MPTTPTSLAAAIGERVRRERQAREWTLDQLSGAAGISRRMLVNVEQGTVNPSIGTLLRLSEALGIPLPALVEPPRTEPITVTRAGDGAALWTSDAGGAGVLLAGITLPDSFELWEWTMAAGDRHESEAHTSGTKELLHVRSGTLVIGVGGEVITLESGDAIAFVADRAHSYANGGDETLVFSMAVLEPGVRP